ncbi:pilus assembly protein [Mesobaculum littorinae]|uniref:Pilus assembly protein n=1 Tax=Mesobaculum littorinae TaxID=2486419 RepID=A0A438AIQ7_9RHOB|nr:pilus assembly protein [Mesobaculum littorinae]RVV98643.1 pilus assembly protein [Mesobaculum littorinae]
MSRPHSLSLPLRLLAMLRKGALRFCADTRGTFSIETVLVVPLLFWSVVVSYVFVDAYRMQGQNVRATYTIGDLLSRQDARQLTPAYVRGLGDLHHYLTNGRHDTWIRVTGIRWRGTVEEYELMWSEPSSGDHPRVTKATLPDLLHQVPDLANGDMVILVESWMTFTPLFELAGFGTQEFHHQMSVSPRFAPQLLMDYS